ELGALERQQAGLAAITAVRSSGGAVQYHQVDLTDADAVAAVIGDIRAAHGRIDVLIHAAGVEISHVLPDKSPREFDLVFDVKSDGWFNLMRAVGTMPLGATVAFTSVAGRFGNGGQTDYAAANDLLCKLTSNLRTSRPATRGIAIDWTAWTGIGMATRGSIPKMMELAGIDVIRPEAGVPAVRRELTAGSTSGEVVIAGRLGSLLDEWHETGGVDQSALVSSSPMIGEAVRMGVHGGLTVETTLDPTKQGFLRDHAMEGTPLLPGVMGIEAFAELASLPLPGWSVAAIEDMRFEAPFKFYRAEPRTLTLHATFAQAGDDLVADCSLIGVRLLRTGLDPRVTKHFAGRVRLSRLPAELGTERIPAPDGPAIPAPTIYQVLFHGPAYQVLAQEWVVGREAVGLMAADLPADHVPASPFVLAPRLIELCLQTAGIWELATSGRLALPLRVERIVASPAGALPAGVVRARAIARDDGAFDVVLADEGESVFVRLEGYHSVELPGEGGEATLQLMKRAAAPELARAHPYSA
ncbi:MAG TPA: SDR family NAD(P)-dependent oxidoreductase, partial [Candidatus Dormibacteraeota bacterium]|nr:SDR family NAD(P)-dependent oxidoreductase [Candidatus Dormibacteraeota bacterium]